jgi:hypothetical protein
VLIDVNLVQLGAKAVHGGNDGQRNAGCDQAVLNGSRAGLINPKFRNNVIMRKRLLPASWTNCKSRPRKRPWSGFRIGEQHADLRFNEPCLIVPRHTPRTASVAPRRGRFLWADAHRRSSDSNKSSSFSVLAQADAIEKAAGIGALRLAGFENWLFMNVPPARGAQS